jgi:hypothetical protein
MNGVNGASRCASVTRQRWSVPKAAGSPSQKRGRERRTYQFESSSTNAAIAWPARVASYSSIRSRTSATVALSREIAQRSSSVSGAAPSAISFAFAYST